MKKISILLALCLGMFTTIQPAAAPIDKAAVAKPLSQRSWSPGPKGISRAIWDQIIDQYIGIEDIKNKLFAEAQRRSIFSIKYPTLWFFLGIQCFACSPDNKHIVAVQTNNKIAIVWDAKNGHEIYRLNGHINDIWSIAYSPDGNFIATGSIDGTVKIWNTINGKEIRTLHGHRDIVFSIAYSPDSQLIVAGSKDGTAKIWNGVTGHEIGTLNGHRLAVQKVACSPDGKYIVTGSWDDTAKIWCTKTRQELYTLPIGRSHIESIAFSPNGKDIIITSKITYQDVMPGGMIFTSWKPVTKILDIETGTEIREILNNHGTRSLEYSPNGKYILIVSSVSNCVRLLSAETGKEIYKLHRINYGITYAKFSADGKNIIIANEYTSEIKIFNISVLDHKFNSEQIQILRLLDEHSIDESKIWLSNIEAQNKQAQILGLKTKFNKIFPAEIREIVIKTYNIQDAKAPQNHMRLYVTGAAVLAGVVAWLKWNQ